MAHSHRALSLSVESRYTPTLLQSIKAHQAADDMTTVSRYDMRCAGNTHFLHIWACTHHVTQPLWSQAGSSCFPRLPHGCQYVEGPLLLSKSKVIV